MEIPYGYCHCGCGQKTLLAPRSRNHKHYKAIKGEPQRFVLGHNPRYLGGPKVDNGMKWCGKCGQIKLLSDFFAARRALQRS